MVQIGGTGKVAATSRSTWKGGFIVGLIAGFFISKSLDFSPRSMYIPLGYVDTQKLQTPADAVTTETSPAVESTRKGTEGLTAHQHYLEELLYKYGSDKSHDDHKYSDFYGMLFNPIRSEVYNVTEIGVAAGQSLQTWYHYFPKAHIHGFDVFQFPSVKNVVAQLKERVHFTKDNVLNYKTPEAMMNRFGLVEESMDIIIEDAQHIPQQQEDLLLHMWKYVKPGGYYIIEDIYLHQEDAQRFLMHPERLSAEATDILQNQGDTILINSVTGHRAWDTWFKLSEPVGAVKDRMHHNSHLIVIHKRSQPLLPDVKINFGDVAMKAHAVKLD